MFWDFSIFFLVSIILFVMVGGILVYKFLETFSDAIDALREFMKVLSKAFPKLSGSQIFNLFADLIMLSWVFITSNSLSGDTKSILISSLVAFAGIISCVFIAFFKRVS